MDNTRRITRRGVLGALGAGIAGALLRPLAAGAEPNGEWSWVRGDDTTFVGVGTDTDAGTLVLQAQGDVDIGANHIRMGTRDGNYEFEHSKDVAETHLNSYYIGTPTRTPISVGGDDGQDVVSFVVRGKQGQANDLQQWAPGGKVTLAVDGHGRLRVGQITLLTEVVRGKARLVAVLPDGTRQVLAG